MLPITATPKSWGVCSIPNMFYPFEIAAVILLVAMVAAIALTLRRRKDAKSQVISDQRCGQEGGSFAYCSDEVSA